MAISHFYCYSSYWQIKWQIYPPQPPAVAFSGQELLFHISTVRAHIGRSSGRPNPQFWHLVIKNGNMTFLLLVLILADQLEDQPPSSGI